MLTGQPLPGVQVGMDGLDGFTIRLRCQGSLYMGDEVGRIVVTRFRQMHLVANPVGVAFLTAAGIGVVGRSQDTLARWHISTATPARLVILVLVKLKHPYPPQ